MAEEPAVMSDWLQSGWHFDVAALAVLVPVFLLFVLLLRGGNRGGR